MPRSPDGSPRVRDHLENDSDERWPHRAVDSFHVSHVPSAVFPRSHSRTIGTKVCSPAGRDLSGWLFYSKKGDNLDYILIFWKIVYINTRYK